MKVVLSRKLVRSSNGPEVYEGILNRPMRSVLKMRFGTCLRFLVSNLGFNDFADSTDMAHAFLI